MSTPSVRRVLRAVAQLATATSLVAVLATAAHAQQPVTKDQPPAGGGGGGGRGAAMAAMMDSLNLTADQRKKVDSINTDFRGKMQGGGDRQALMQQRTAAIKAVLTPEQATKYDAMMEAMRARMGGGRP
jgi:Spy/CpxP family protein refolding chaperone